MTSPAEAERFHRARLITREFAGGGLTRVTVDPGRYVASTYTSPGQYIEVRVGGESGYFVLANAPGAAEWQLIMRRGGGASDVLLSIAPGGALEVTDAIGSGFPMDASRGRPVLIALGGTGVAAALPLVGRRVADGDATRQIAFIFLVAFLGNLEPFGGLLQGPALRQAIVLHRRFDAAPNGNFFIPIVIVCHG